MSVDVFFDYTCGFSNRGRHWLDALEDTELVWKPFSLLEQNARNGGRSVFERAEYADNVSLIALAVHEQVDAQGGDLEAYRRRMFTAWHEEPGRLSTEDIRDASLSAAAAHHAEAATLGVFGTPTPVLATDQVLFLELDAVPALSRSRSLWEAVGQLADSGPEVREWQRVLPPDR